MKLIACGNQNDYCLLKIKYLVHWISKKIYNVYPNALYHKILYTSLIPLHPIVFTFLLPLVNSQLLWDSHFRFHIWLRLISNCQSTHSPYHNDLELHPFCCKWKFICSSMNSVPQYSHSTFSLSYQQLMNDLNVCFS